MDDHGGWRHDAAVFTSDAGLLAVTVPFVSDALAHGEPVLVSLPAALAQLVVAALPRGVEGVTIVPHEELYRRPAVGLRALRRAIAGLRGDDGRRIRVLGAPPLPAAGRSWQPWARFEASLATALAASPVWSRCVFDGRVASPAVLDDVRRTHPHLVDPATGPQENPACEEPQSFLRDGLRREANEEPSPPMATVTDPTPHEVRRLVAQVASGTRLRAEDCRDLVTAVSEITTNALHHGRPPVVVRIWSDADHVTVRVRDSGPGPDDPGAGLTEADRVPGAGGMGLWLAHLLCSEVTMRVDDEGFEVRLTALAD